MCQVQIRFCCRPRSYLPCFLFLFQCSNTLLTSDASSDVFFLSFFLSLLSVDVRVRASAYAESDRERRMEERIEEKDVDECGLFHPSFVRLFSCLLEKEEEDERPCVDASARHRRSFSSVNRYLCRSTSTKSLRRDRLFLIAHETDVRLFYSSYGYSTYKNGRGENVAHE
jgi:hypothetical protein